jgi:hypothetical protein
VLPQFDLARIVEDAVQVPVSPALVANTSARAVVPRRRLGVDLRHYQGRAETGNVASWTDSLASTAGQKEAG